MTNNNLEQRIIQGKTYTVNPKKCDKNFLYDTQVTYGRKDIDPSVIVAYGQHYDLPGHAVVRNMAAFKEYIRTGDVVRFDNSSINDLEPIATAKGWDVFIW